MSVFRVNGALITEENDIRDMSADHFEALCTPTAGADLEIKRGVFHLPETQLSRGSGGAVSPPVGPGQIKFFSVSKIHK